jgi:N-methylhydantoinase A/oxoprolinase/acetone carboxylase beta subunit
MRYVGQAFEISVVLDSELKKLTLETLLTAFSDAHHRIFEFSKPQNDPVEIISFRIGARAKTDAFPIQFADGPAAVSSEVEHKEVEVLEKGESLKCKLLEREMVPAAGVQGPLLIEDGTSTIFVPRNWISRRDAQNCLVLERSSIQ